MLKKDDIIKAIITPKFVRRTFAALREDPGPLELVYAAIDETDPEYPSLYCVYHSESRYYLIADLGPIPSLYIHTSLILLMDSYFRTCNLESRPTNLLGLGIAHHNTEGGYKVVDYSAEGHGHWYSIVCGRDAPPLEEIVANLEARHDH